MPQTIEVVDPQKSAAAFGNLETFALDVLVGLSEERKTLPSKYMYDDAGSRLFERITSLDEYYLTHCELDVLRRHGARIARYAPDRPFNLVEFGAGADLKPGVIVESLTAASLDFDYVPLDISRDAMERLTQDMLKRFPALKVHGLVSEYFSGIKWLNNHETRPNFVLFLGSNIGNFTRAQSHVFLRNLWNSLNDGDRVLIGFDLRKDIEMLLAAYNDRAGVTAEFNLNLLRRINRELGGEFDVGKFRHFGTYNVFNGAMESYLVSQEQQEVFIEHIGRSFHFQPWEPIHTEYSYKYLESDIDLLARDTGFRVLEHLHDARNYFIDSVWEVRKIDAGNGG